MRKIFPAAFITALLFSSCTKNSVCTGNADTEYPVIKIISPLQIPRLQPGEYLTIKAAVSDNRMLHTVAWEAINAASACGNNPYKAEYSPGELVHEMNIKFLVPALFSGNRILRLYALDQSGNVTMKDVEYYAED